jgi:hypothetical protein
MTDFGTPGSFPSAPMPPSSGDRTGPPWEQPGAFFSRWIDTAKMILLNPQGGFANVRRTGGLGAPLTYYLVGAALSLVAQLLFQMIGFGSAMSSLSRMGGETSAAGSVAMAGGLIGGLIFGVIVMVVMPFILSGIVHLVLSLLGGTKHGYETTFRALTYSWGSSSPLGIVPFCGGLIGFIWGLVCAIMGLADMQETTPVKSALAILIPFVLCCGLVMVIGVAVFGMMAAAIGGAASSQ